MAQDVFCGFFFWKDPAYSFFLQVNNAKVPSSPIVLLTAFRFRSFVNFSERTCMNRLACLSLGTSIFQFEIDLFRKNFTDSSFLDRRNFGNGTTY